ncbi:bacterio-opsin activator domain-containing protein [Saliphagus infecundisoli]|uniref:Bacterio-opsin activator domain-containing protein n=1 Tax=Saliphagus infecundisoli TaxID=1849069 RepID=A0ABD5QFH7_9EURY|nr:bacterio-opsin activator domain-containing protein [Saliphagus infecundisoli]
MGGTVVEIGLAAEEFALSQTAARFEDLQYEIERVVAHDTDHVMPYVWIDGPSVGEIESVLEDDDSVEEFDRLADLEEERLYRMEWVDQIDTLVQILVEEDGAILSAQGNGDDWTLRILFPTRDALSRTHDYCEDQGLRMDIYTIYNVDDGRKGRFGLTDSQQDTLLSAFERGYYEIPRDTSMTELAEEMDVSHQALSERLRRGHEALVENTVVIGREDGTENEREKREA